MTPSILKIIAALAPAVVLLIMIVRKDKANPEPRRWLVAGCALGVASALLVILAGILFLPPMFADTLPRAIMTSFVGAAIPEELAKFLMLFILAKMCRHFDEMIDGVVYAVCIGMGFAGFENILYVTGSDDWLVISLTRALLSVPAHYFFAIIMGAFFSLAWFDRKNRTAYMSAAILIPILAHGIYDSLCFIMPMDDTASGTVLIIFLLSFNWLRKYVRSLVDSCMKLDTFGPAR